MKIRTLSCGFVLGVAGTAAIPHAVSQDHGAMPDMAAMMEAHAKATTPGPHHERLEALVGEWETTTKVWWGGPGSHPIETTGEMSTRWICDGRFVASEGTSEFMMPDPQTGQMKAMPVTMHGVTGYDNFRNLYVGTTVSSMGTHIQAYKGGVDPSGRRFTFYGDMDEPMLGIYGRTVKYTTEIVDDDTHVFEVYDLHARDDYKVIEVTYRRKGSG